MQQIFRNAGGYTEALGLLLAVLSFTGANRKIEAALSDMRQRIADYAPVLRNGLGDFIPTPKNIRRYGKDALWMSFVLITLFLIGMQSEADSRSNLQALYSAVLPWTLWKVVLGVIGIIPGLYMLWATIGFVAGLAFYVVLSIIWAGFWLLSRPPSGVTGSIGLVIALSGTIMRFANGA